MNLRPLVIFGVGLFAAVLVLTAWTWVQLPADAVVATHWGLNGEVNGHMPKAPGLLIGPAIMIVLMAFYWVITRIEPRRNNLVRSKAPFAVALIGGLAVGALAQTLIDLTALGIRVPVGAVVLPAVALLNIVIGNFLSKTRANFFVGVRTPWTLESDYSWEKTNRWAGRFFIFSGIATLAATLVFSNAVATYVLIVTLVTGAVVSIVLSYVFWRRDPERHAHDSVPE
jgi:uncharacterized membrane protein